MKPPKYFPVILLVCAVLALPHAAAGNSVEVHGDAGSVDWTEGIIEADGFGVCPPDLAPTENERKMLAMRAAQNDAYRNLAEVVTGIHVTAETTVRDMITEKDVIHTMVNSYVRGAQRMGEPKYETQSDGSISCALKMQAPLAGDGGFARKILPYARENLQKQLKRTARETLDDPQNVNLTLKVIFKDEEEPAARPDNPPANAASGPADEPIRIVISGILINTVNTEYDRNLFPTILSLDERTIFDFTVSETWDALNGFTPYSETIENGKLHPRVARTPIEVKAVKVEGMVVFISNEDADRIIAANNELKLLNKGRIVFVVAN